MSYGAPRCQRVYYLNGADPTLHHNTPGNTSRYLGVPSHCYIWKSHHRNNAVLTFVYHFNAYFISNHHWAMVLAVYPNCVPMYSESRRNACRSVVCIPYNEWSIDSTLYEPQTVVSHSTSGSLIVVSFSVRCGRSMHHTDMCFSLCTMN